MSDAPKPEQNPPEAVLGGLYSDFPGFEARTELATERALRHGLVVPDANVLLNLYRYTDSARDSCLDVLAALKDRLFVPHQVVSEFWANREAVIRDRPRPVADVLKAIHDLQSQLSGNVGSLANRLGLTPQERAQVDRRLTDCHQPLLDHLRTYESKTPAIDPEDHAGDPVVAKLTTTLNGRVGRTPSDPDRHLKEARRRLDLKLPPGYLDAKKGDARALGDCLLWLESIDEVDRRSASVLVIVTDDAKGDWWRVEFGQTRGPRPELALEARRDHGADLFMMRLPTLLFHAKAALGIAVSGENVAQITLSSPKQATTAANWTMETAMEFLDRLGTEAPVQRAVLVVAVSNDGFVSRDQIYRLGGYPDSRALKGFTKPIRRITQQMQEEGILPDSVPEALVAVYDSATDPGSASGFRCAPEFAECAKQGLAAQASGAACEVSSVTRSPTPTGGDYTNFDVVTNLGAFVTSVSGSALAQSYKRPLEDIVAHFAKQQIPRTRTSPGSRLPTMLMAAEATNIDELLDLLG